MKNTPGFFQHFFFMSVISFFFVNIADVLAASPANTAAKSPSLPTLQAASPPLWSSSSSSFYSSGWSAQGNHLLQFSSFSNHSLDNHFSEPIGAKNPKNSWVPQRTPMAPKSTFTTEPPRPTQNPLPPPITQLMPITTTMRRTAGKCPTSTTKPTWRRVCITAKWTAWPEATPVCTAPKTTCTTDWKDTPIPAKKVPVLPPDYSSGSKYWCLQLTSAAGLWWGHQNCFSRRIVQALG